MKSLHMHFQPSLPETKKETWSLGLSNVICYVMIMNTNKKFNLILLMETASAEFALETSGGA